MFLYVETRGEILETVIKVIPGERYTPYGLALKLGLSMPNSPGTIDADYRGEIKVLLINLGTEPITLTRGMRIAQMVICPVVQGTWVEEDHVDDLPTSDRGTGGFGSTGH